MRILVIDDEPSLRRTLRLTLESMRFEVCDAASAAAAIAIMERQRVDVALVDLRLGRDSGLELLPKLLAAEPGLGVIIMTAHATVSTAVEAMRNGAFDYLPKPFTPDQLRVAIDRWQTVHGLRMEVRNLKEQLSQGVALVDLQSREPAMQEALDLAFRAAASEAAILLRGESGTGKGVVARAIHAKSHRAARPFVTVHAPSLSGELLESDLFGHARGAFTGAVQDTEGKVATAEGGTLFLDEIGDLPLALQPKLLRFLQEKAYERVGENRTRVGNVRFITATNRDLEEETRQGRFREDLLYRLNVIEIRLPPLRERRADIVPIAESLMRFFAVQTGKRIDGFRDEAKDAIAGYGWPGNLRELRNAVERAVILTRNEWLGPADLPVTVMRADKATTLELGGDVTLDQLEAEHIRQVVDRSASLEEAAAVLGIDPSTLYRKRKRHGSGLA